MLQRGEINKNKSNQKYERLTVKYAQKYAHIIFNSFTNVVHL